MKAAPRTGSLTLYPFLPLLLGHQWTISEHSLAYCGGGHQSMKAALRMSSLTFGSRFTVLGTLYILKYTCIRMVAL